MYDELVKRMRLCEQFRCRECEYEQVLGCREKLNAEAADAIEDLSAAVEGYESSTNMALVVEVVHCKDCAYMERGVKDSDEVWCCWHDSRMTEDDFCSRGKEK